jgi:hypothetical protein
VRGVKSRLIPEQRSFRGCAVIGVLALAGTLAIGSSSRATWRDLGAEDFGMADTSHAFHEKKRNIEFAVNSPDTC